MFKSLPNGFLPGGYNAGERTGIVGLKMRKHGGQNVEGAMPGIKRKALKRFF